jgi:hypothetical protein
MMNDDFESMDGDYSVNLNAVIKDKNSSAVTKLLASTLMNESYMTVGDFLLGLSDSDLDFLLEAVNEEQNMEDLLLITEMLVSAEGLSGSKTIEEATTRVNSFGTFVVLESLYRKGLIKVHHKNLSFGEDMGDKMVAEKI